MLTSLLETHNPGQYAFDSEGNKDKRRDFMLQCEKNRLYNGPGGSVFSSHQPHSHALNHF